MNNLMEYGGYHAKIEFAPDDGCFVGRVLGVQDTLMFDGETVTELQESFRACIDEYLEMCKEIGREPDKEFKGSFNVRISPALHKYASLYAAGQELSLNQVIAKSVEEYLIREDPSLATRLA